MTSSEPAAMSGAGAKGLEKVPAKSATPTPEAVLRSAIDALRKHGEDAIADLKTEKERWQDDAFIAQQARERFGYVQRGETPYVVVGEDGEPLDGTAELTDPDSVGDTEPRAWYGDMWESMKVAGNPPTRIPGSPSERIDPPKEDLAE